MLWSCIKIKIVYVLHLISDLCYLPFSKTYEYSISVLYLCYTITYSLVSCIRYVSFQLKTYPLYPETRVFPQIIHLLDFLITTVI